MMDIDNRSIGLSVQIDLAHQTDFDIGNMRLRPSLREVEIEGETITLEPRVMQVLVALARDPGEVVSKVDLIQTCWDGREVGDDAITRCIAAIRRLSRSGGIEITTIPRVGYRLMVTSRDAGSSPQHANTEQDATQGKADSRHPSWLYGRFAWTTVAVLLLAMGTAWYAFNGSSSPAVLSVAVLPFEASSQDQDETAYARSMAAGLAERIDQPAIDVISPTQSFRFSGDSKHRAYREIPATYIIDGSVRRDEGTIRVTVHFDNRETGEALFSKSFEAPEQQALLLSKRVAAQIAFRMRDLPSIDPAKPDQAKEILRFWDLAAGGNTNGARALMVKLAAQSPDRGKLQVHSASATAFTIGTVPMALRPARHEEATRLVEKAAQMEPHDPQLFIARTMVLPASDWMGRELVLREGLKLHPADPDLLYALGFQRLLSGHLFDASNLFEAAGKRDSNSFWLAFDASVASRLTQRWDRALIHLETASATVDESLLPLLVGNKSRILAETGDYDAALALLSSWPLGALKADQMNRLPALLLMADKTGQADEISAALAACRTAPFPVTIFGFCWPIQSENGEIDDAFAQIKHVVPMLDGATPDERKRAWFKALDLPISRFSIPQLYHPRSQAIRSDPRFTALARQLALVDYWRATGPPDFCLRETAPVCELVKPQEDGEQS